MFLRGLFYFCGPTKTIAIQIYFDCSYTMAYLFVKMLYYKWLKQSSIYLFENREDERIIFI